ncbi:MAG: spermidine/putrescine ABC transporter substrate-binding protein [Chloroflexi bacterium]|nr:spermidine/putrescine ABC transporter substrate-binding protein [Chloroflexota bacterium]
MAKEEAWLQAFERRISRRSLLHAGGLAIAGLAGGAVLNGCGGQASTTPSSAGAAQTTTTSAQTATAAASQTATSAANAQLTSKELNIWTWGIYAPDFAVKSFEEQYGVKLNVTFYHGNEELWSKLQAGHQGVDIIQPSNNYVQRMAQTGLIAPLDEAMVPHFEGVYDSFKTANYAFFDNKRYSFPFVFGVTGIVYNTQQVTPKPDSWQVMWDEKYKGKITMESNEEWIYAAGMFLGLDIEKLDQDTDAKLAQIEAKLREQKPLLLKNYESLEEVKNLLATGDVWLGQTDDGLAWGLAIDGMPIQTVIPKEGATSWADQFCILADAPHKDAAYAWINHMFEPHNAAEMAKEVGYMTVNAKANEFLDPKLQKVMTHTDEELARVHWLPYYAPEIMQKITQVYEDVRAG